MIYKFELTSELILAVPRKVILLTDVNMKRCLIFSLYLHANFRFS